MTEEEKFKRNKRELLRIARRLLKDKNSTENQSFPENILPMHKNTSGYGGFSRN